MHGAEGVVHVGTVFAGQRRKFCGELGARGCILGGFTGVETHVFQHQHRAVGESAASALADSPTTSVAHETLSPESSAELGGCGCDRVLGIRFALGAAQVCHHDDACAGLGQLLHHGDGGAYTPIVGDGNAIERHVQVATDQNAPPEDTVGE